MGSILICIVYPYGHFVTKNRLRVTSDLKPVFRLSADQLY
jgi:hypothetical protein